MRINSYIAFYTGLSRRKVDQLIQAGQVCVDDKIAQVGMDVNQHHKILIEGQPLVTSLDETIILLNKPVGFVVSRNGQGSKTIYQLLPQEYHQLKPVGRLDKDSSGLLILTNNGLLANNLTHPSKHKTKTYNIKLDQQLSSRDIEKINRGVMLDDGISHLHISSINPGNNIITVVMQEGKNRQIRRTFASLKYRVTYLHRITFGEYKIDDLKLGEYRIIK